MKRDFAKRFFSFIEHRDNGCWIWMGGTNSGGYGLFTIDRKLKLAHRVSWEFTYGFSPDGLVVCHRCDDRKCVNPEHLFLGDNKDNAKDKMTKGRHVQAYGNTKLTIDKVKEIRNLWVTGNYSQLKLAEMFKVKHSCIGRVINNDVWCGINLEPISKELWKSIHNKRKIMNFTGVDS